MNRTLAALALSGTLAAQAGTFAGSGTGCPAPFPPTLWSSIPTVGMPALVRCDDLPVDTLAVALFVGNAQVTVPLDALGATGCAALVDQTFAVELMSLAATTASYTIDVPDDPLLIGTVLELQALGLSASSNPAGFTLSERGTMTVGDATFALRDTITAAPSFTEGNAAYGVGWLNSSTFAIPVRNNSGRPLSIDELSFVLADFGPYESDWSTTEYALLFWPDTFHRNSDPLCEEPGTTRVADLQDTAVVPWGQYTTNYGLRTTRRVTFDIAGAADLVVPPGTVAWVGLQASTTISLSTLGVLESDAEGESDWSHGFGWQPVASFGVTVEDGRVGAEVVVSVQ